MRKHFKRVKAKCYICETPLTGDKILKRGNKYYCGDDFQKKSSQEKLANSNVEYKMDLISKLYA